MGLLPQQPLVPEIYVRESSLVLAPAAGVQLEPVSFGQLLNELPSDTNNSDGCRMLAGLSAILFKNISLHLPGFTPLNFSLHLQDFTPFRPGSFVTSQLQRRNPPNMSALQSHKIFTVEHPEVRMPSPEPLRQGSCGNIREACSWFICTVVQEPLKLATASILRPLHARR